MAASRIALAAGLALALAGTSSASIISRQLSSHSSDETDAGVLSATFDFEINGFGQLELTVTNDTSGLDTYNISEIYFNGPDGITLSLSSGPVGWAFSTGDMVDGFGIFDFGMIDGVGGEDSLLMPGESETFVFDISGGAPGVKDFTTALSFPDGGISMFIAAKFINGPGDDSAFGGFVPGPGTLALLGAAGLLGRRRRRR